MMAAGNKFILCDKISGVPAYTPYNGISGKWLRAERTFLGVLPQAPIKINKLAIFTGKTWTLFLQKLKNFQRCLTLITDFINS